jgi:4-hydroxy-tetrahydrodipicolinate synthase
MKQISLKGMVPAAILPMDATYQPDFDQYEHYLKWLIDNGALALAVNMDTGEGPQLTEEERLQVVRVAVKVAAGRAAVMAGLMGASTEGAVSLAKAYKEAGSDGLVIFPNAAFRNDPLDIAIPYGYHKAIAETTDMPLMLFQLAPVFGGVLYTRETLLKLLEIPQVTSIKEASFDAQYYTYTVETVRMSGRPITILTGNDRFITESILLGAEGALLGFGAVGCPMVAEMLRLANAGKFGEVAAMRNTLQRFADVIYADPVLDYRARCKAALAILGIIDRELTYVRLPLLPTPSEDYPTLQQALEEAGMLVHSRV